jgi:hypothetical protein
MRVPRVLSAALLAALLAGCSPPEPDRPSMVAAPQIARDALKAASNAYPLDTCVVTGEKLDSKGAEEVFVHEGVEVHLCCVDCKKEFLADPEPCLAKIRAAKAGK